MNTNAAILRFTRVAPTGAVFELRGGAGGHVEAVVVSGANRTRGFAAGFTACVLASGHHGGITTRAPSGSSSSAAALRRRRPGLAWPGGGAADFAPGRGGT